MSGGRPKGVWPTAEWFPILVKSSVSLGAMPDASGVCFVFLITLIPTVSQLTLIQVASWLGADTMSAIIVDIALRKHSTSLPRALNVVHPRPVRQSVIMMHIRKAIADIVGHELVVVPLSQWFSILEERAEDVTAETWADIVCTSTF